MLMYLFYKITFTTLNTGDAGRPAARDTGERGSWTGREIRLEWHGLLKFNVHINQLEIWLKCKFDSATLGAEVAHV